MKFEAYEVEVKLVVGGGEVERGVKFGVGTAGVVLGGLVMAGLGVDFVGGRGVVGLARGREKVLCGSGFVGCGAIVLVWPKDNLGDVRLAKEDVREGLVAWTGVGAPISRPPNADDKSPSALDCPPATAVADVTTDGAVVGCAGLAGAYNFSIEFFKSFRDVGLPPFSTGALCVRTGESNSSPNKLAFVTLGARTLNDGLGVRDRSPSRDEELGRDCSRGCPVARGAVRVTVEGRVGSECSRGRCCFTRERGTSSPSSSEGVGRSSRADGSRGGVGARIQRFEEYLVRIKFSILESEGTCPGGNDASQYLLVNNSTKERKHRVSLSRECKPGFTGRKHRV